MSFPFLRAMLNHDNVYYLAYYQCITANLTLVLYLDVPQSPALPVSAIPKYDVHLQHACTSPAYRKRQSHHAIMDGDFHERGLTAFVFRVVDGQIGCAPGCHYRRCPGRGMGNKIGHANAVSKLHDGVVGWKAAQ
jgi:hypothetical protein